MVEEAPHACVAEAAAREVGEGVGVLPREVGVLAREPSHLASIGDDVLRVDDVLLVLHVELAYAALVGMGAYSIVGDTHSHPHNALGALASALHLHDPRLIGVADGECLALGAVAILLHERSHHADGLACRLGALQSHVDERAIVEDARGVDHLLASAIGGLGDGELKLVDVAYHVVGDGSLGYFAMILSRVPIVDLAHRALRVGACWIVAEVAEHAVVVGVVGHHHRAVDTRLLAHDIVGAGRG